MPKTVLVTREPGHHPRPLEVEALVRIGQIGERHILARLIEALAASGALDRDALRLILDRPGLEIHEPPTLAEVFAREPGEST